MRFTHVVAISLVGMGLYGSPLLAKPSPAQLEPRPLTASDAPHERSIRAPLVVEAPGDVEISIEIVPTAHTKELRVYADSDSYYRSTTIALNGANSKPIHTFTWRGFPAGDYDVVGILVDDTGSSEVVVQGALRVVGRH